MNDRTSGMVFSGLVFLTGFLTGLVTGLLLAPRPGGETRRQLRHLADDASSAADRLIEDARQAANTVFEQTKRLVS